MAKMKAIEFTDKLNLQPVIRPVPEPQAGEILIQVSAGRRDSAPQSTDRTP